MKTSEILNLSADSVQGRGWVQGGTPQAGDAGPWGGGAGSSAPVCLEGGILAAMGISLGNSCDLPPDDFTFCPAYRAVQNYLGMDVGDLVFEWNDEDGRTAEEVIEVLRACALIEESRENAEVKVLEPAR